MFETSHASQQEGRAEMTQTLEGIALLPPWRAALPNEQSLAIELQREVGPAHPLFGKKALVLAKRGDNDDVLFLVEGVAEPFAVVHLTWRDSREEGPLWPHTVFFETLDRWIDDGMRIDHAEYIGSEEG